MTPFFFSQMISDENEQGLRNKKTFLLALEGVSGLSINYAKIELLPLKLTGGFLILVNAVLGAVPWLSMSKIPVEGRSEKLESLRSNWIWNGTQVEQKKYHLVSWDKVSRRKELGGLGILNCFEMNQTRVVKVQIEYADFSSKWNTRSIV